MDAGARFAQFCHDLFVLSLNEQLELIDLKIIRQPLQFIRQRDLAADLVDRVWTDPCDRLVKPAAGWDPVGRLFYQLRRSIGPRLSVAVTAGALYKRTPRC